jgi:putative transposase
MRQVGILNHSRWECKYHVVFIPKYRRKAIFGQIRRDLGGVLKRLTSNDHREEIARPHVAAAAIRVFLNGTLQGRVFQPLDPENQ